MNKIYPYFAFILLIFLESCATFKTQQAYNPEAKVSTSSSNRIYLVGDAGMVGESQKNVFTSLENAFKNAEKQDILLFLGDNIYPKGMPEKGELGRKEAETSLIKQLELAKKFKGKVFFIPGNHDWYHGIKGLAREEKYVNNYLGEKAFQPANNCPISSYELNDETTIIFIDSEWYLTDWNKHPEMLESCPNIDSRAKFFLEFSSLMNKNQNKNVIIAMHHPLASKGFHGGNYSFNSFGNPILSLPLNFLLKSSGVSPADLNYPHYRELSNKMTTILQEYKSNVVVVSGHEHNLQLLFHQEIPQIISGAGAKKSPLKKAGKTDYPFGFADNGFAVLSINQQEKEVSFFDEQGKIINSFHLNKNQNSTIENNLFPSSSANTKFISIYSDDTTKHAKTWLNKHYRKYYYQKYHYPVVMLDTLSGGLTPLRLGGGNQSISLRLQAKDGKEFVLRRMKKSATQFLQMNAFQEEYVKDKLRNTVTEGILEDLYTTAYPFAPLIASSLSEIAGVYHTNPQIFYIPHQPSLGKFNDVIGDDVYLFEERPSKKWRKEKFFGNGDDIVSTDEVIQNRQQSEKYTIDRNQYIKTRLFDMWLGDWDRHEDQYRWLEKKKGNQIYYSPIPRDRDQAFPKFDGLMFNIAKLAVPLTRAMQTFDDDLRNVKMLNNKIYRLDMLLINQSTENEWLAMADSLSANLTDERINQIFAQIAPQWQDETSLLIKENLLKRRKHLKDWAKQYYRVLNRESVVVGTENEDKIIVTRLQNGDTEVKVYHKRKGENKLFFSKIYHKDLTHKIWIYGLQENDTFEVLGDHHSPIKVSLLGGWQNDKYLITNNNNLKIIDYKTKKNTFEGTEISKTLTDNFEANNFNFLKLKYTVGRFTPILSYNPDQGVIMGINASVTNFNMTQSSFTNPHTLKIQYFSATNGVDLSYSGEYGNVFGDFNLGIDFRFTPPSFAFNFFGIGNQSPYSNDDDFQINRVRQQQVLLSPSLIKRGLMSKWATGISFENVKLIEDKDRLAFSVLSSKQFENKQILGLETMYEFKNQNNVSNPSLGMKFMVKLGFKYNLTDGNNLPFLSSALGFHHPIIANEILTYSTNFKTHLNFSNDFTLFQAAQIGGLDGLRGFRNQRFTGRNSFMHISDLRLQIFKFRTGLFPIKAGIFGGFDYGRVWLKNEISDKWHLSAGGGIFANAASQFTFNASFFDSEDVGGRFTMSLFWGF